MGLSRAWFGLTVAVIASTSMNGAGCRRGGGAAICGNGLEEAPEACDDGNVAAGDGCSPACTIEKASPCGNATLDPGEACDGSELGGETCGSLGFFGGTLACAADCTALDDTGCNDCGDGTVGAGEACDDGNATGADGCTACATDARYSCTGAPSFCVRPPSEPGDLVFTEIMRNPYGPDVENEWFEIHNPSAGWAELDGMSFNDDTGFGFGLSGSLLVPPGGYAVFSRDEDGLPTEGLNAVSTYGGTFLLADTGMMALQAVGATGALVDEVWFFDEYPSANGVAVSLDPDHAGDALANDDWSNWCAAAFWFNYDDRGTPGRENPTCTPLVVAAGDGQEIPDGDPTGVTFDVTVPAAESCVMSGLWVRMELLHTRVGDLEIEVVAPTGASVRLLDRPGVPETAAGNTDDLVDSFTGEMGVLFFQDGESPFPQSPGGTGVIEDYAFAPEGPGALADFAGLGSAGTWSLVVRDQSPGETGVVGNWTLMPLCTFSASGGGGAIPDAATTTWDLSVTAIDSCTGAQPTVTATLTHTWVGDLDIRLYHLGTGWDWRLLDRSDNPGDGDDLSGTYTWIANPDYDSPYPAWPDFYAGGTVVPPGTYQSEETIGMYPTMVTETYRLSIADFIAPDPGTLTSWSLDVECNQDWWRSIGTPAWIDENAPAGASDVLSVAAACTLASVTVDVSISHSVIGSLTVTLTSPAGTTVALEDADGGAGLGIYGSYPWNLLPAGDLSAFAGESAAGDWTITVTDVDADGQSGTLWSWGLQLDCL